MVDYPSCPGCLVTQLPVTFDYVRLVQLIRFVCCCLTQLHPVGLRVYYPARCYRPSSPVAPVTFTPRLPAVAVTPLFVGSQLPCLYTRVARLVAAFPFVLRTLRWLRCALRLRYVYTFVWLVTRYVRWLVAVLRFGLRLRCGCGLVGYTLRCGYLYLRCVLRLRYTHVIFAFVTFTFTRSCAHVCCVGWLRLHALFVGYFYTLRFYVTFVYTVYHVLRLVATFTHAFGCSSDFVDFVYIWLVTRWFVQFFCSVTFYVVAFVVHSVILQLFCTFVFCYIYLRLVTLTLLVLLRLFYTLVGYVQVVPVRLRFTRSLRLHVRLVSCGCVRLRLI